MCADDQRAVPGLRLAAGQLGDQPARASRHRGAITATDWVQPGGGESGYIAVKPGRPEHRGRRRGGQRARHGPAHPLRPPHRAGAHHQRVARGATAWARRRPSTATGSSGRSRCSTRAGTRSELWIAGNRIFRSVDEGQRWEIVSPDLTRNDATKIGPSGGPITNDNTGAEVYCTIFALVESPHERDVLWAGTDDGLVHLSRDRGQSWQPVTPPELPEWALISVHRALAARRGHLLPGGHALQARRHAPLSLQDHRLRAHLDADQRRPARRRVHARDPRGSGPARAPLLRHRDRRVGLARRRRRPGRGCAATCRWRRSTTSSSRTATSSRPPTAARSGSSTTSPRCIRWRTRSPPPTPSCWCHAGRSGGGPTRATA